ncbi:MAG: hypothetical protein K6F33_07145 [Bacteroidales bacterium]|nr:hypothetical protein [Bacteroidales bacterium]
MSGRKSGESALFAYIRQVLYSSRVGSLIRWSMVVVSIVVVSAMLVSTYYSLRDSNRAVIKTMLSTSSDGVKEAVVGRLEDVITSAKVVGNAFMSIRDDNSPVRADRKAFLSMLRNSVPGFHNCYAVGMYWEWLAFDGEEKNMEVLPEYKKLYGRFASMYAVADSAVVWDLEFEFSELQCDDVRRKRCITFFPPELKTINGVKRMAMPVYVPMVRDEAYYGSIICYVNTDYIQQCTQQFNLDSANVELLVYDKNLNIISSPKPGTVGKRVTEVFGKNLDVPELFANNKIHVFDGDSPMRLARSFDVDESGGMWAVVFLPGSKSISKGLVSSISPLIITTIIALILAYIFGAFLGYRIGYPLVLVLNVCKKLSSGDMNFNMNFKLFFHNEISSLYREFAKMTDSLKKIVGEVKQTASSINNYGAQLSKSSLGMAKGANEQAAASEEVSAAMEDMSIGIVKNSDNARKTEEITRHVVSSVTAANKYVSATADAMKKMSEKIGVINEIAGKTDLLAVNASIEAARAGELGKGFAVVASEVRKLAEKSQAAAREIDLLTANVASQAEKSNHQLEVLVPEISKTSQLVQEISASTMEQNQNAAQVNNAMQQLNDITQQNAATAEQLTAGANESLRLAEKLNNTMAFFRFDSNRQGEIAELNNQIARLLNRIEDIKKSDDNTVNNA